MQRVQWKWSIRNPKPGNQWTNMQSDSENNGHNRYVIFNVFCRLSATTKVAQHQNAKSFSGCSSTREQCRATTWCLRRRTWRRPTKVDVSADGKRPGCSETRPDVQQPLYSSSSAPPSQLALSFFFILSFFFLFFFTLTLFQTWHFQTNNLLVPNRQCVLWESHWRTTTFALPFFCAATLIAFLCASHSRSQIRRLRQSGAGVLRGAGEDPR